MALGYLPLCLAAVHLFDGGSQFLEVDGIGDGDVVRGEEQLDARFECGQSHDRSGVGGEIGLRNKKVNRPRIKRVASEEQAVRPIEQRKGIWSMAGSEDHFQPAAAKIEAFTVAQGMMARPGADFVRALSYARRQRSAEPLGGKRIAGVNVAFAAHVAARVGQVAIPDLFELRVAPNVIEVRMGIDDRDGERGEPGNDCADSADSQSGIKENRALAAEDEIGNDFLKLLRLVDREDAGPNLVDLKPRLIAQDALQRLVLRTRQLAAPFRTNRLSGFLSESDGDQEQGSSQARSDHFFVQVLPLSMVIQDSPPLVSTASPGFWNAMPVMSAVSN